MNYKETILELNTKAIDIAIAKQEVDLDIYEVGHVELHDDTGCVVVFIEKNVWGGQDPDEHWVDVTFEDFDISLEDIKMEAEKRRLAHEQFIRVSKEKEDFAIAEHQLKKDKELYEKLKKQFE